MARRYSGRVLADGNFTSDKMALEVLIIVETRLWEMVIEYLLDGKKKQGYTYPALTPSGWFVP